MDNRSEASSYKLGEGIPDSGATPNSGLQADVQFQGRWNEENPLLQ